MTNQPSRRDDAADTQMELADRVAALELFTQQLVFLLDVHNAVRADALERWLTTVTDRMREHRSATPAQLRALQLLTQRVA
jgi:hypothetical protein